MARSINPRPHYQLESFSSRADNGRWLILRAITKPIIKDYNTEFCLLPKVSTQDPIITSRALAQGLIMAKGRYWDYILLITYSMHCLTPLTYSNVSKTEDWHKLNVTSRHYVI